jgi:hypothetical protein
MAMNPRRNFPNPKFADDSVLVPSRCPSCGDVESRLAWFDAKLLPAYRMQRTGMIRRCVLGRAALHRTVAAAEPAERRAGSP